MDKCRMCIFARRPRGQIGELPIKVTCGDTLIKTTTEGAGARSTVTSRRQLSGDQVAMEGQSGKVKRTPHTALVLIWHCREEEEKGRWG